VPWGARVPLCSLLSDWLDRICFGGSCHLLLWAGATIGRGFGVFEWMMVIAEVSMCVPIWDHGPCVGV